MITANPLVDGLYKITLAPVEIKRKTKELLLKIIGPIEIPTARLLPSGGTTGQVLKKQSNADYDTIWQNESGGGGGVDPTAIHTDIDSEIDSLTEKVTPDDDDLLVIEDSDDSLNKKKLKIKNLPSGGGSNKNLYLIDLPPESPSPLDDEFNGAGISASWNIINPGSRATLSLIDRGLLVEQTSASGDNFFIIYQTIPAGNFTIMWKGYFLYNVFKNYHQIQGALFQDAGDGSKGLYLFGLNTDNTAFNVMVQRWNNKTSWNSNLALNALTYTNTIPLYFRIRRISTTYYFEFSANGLVWLKYYSGSLAFTPLHFGLTCSNQASGKDYKAIYQFFRYSDDGEYGSAIGGNLL